MISDGWAATAYMVDALKQRMRRQYERRRAMVEDGGYDETQFALIDKAMTATAWDLLMLGAGADLLKAMREGQR